MGEEPYGEDAILELRDPILRPRRRSEPAPSRRVHGGHTISFVDSSCSALIVLARLPRAGRGGRKRARTRDLIRRGERRKQIDHTKKRVSPVRLADAVWSWVFCIYSHTARTVSL